jgi:sterol desaturase/sphingolipid hydroxylase (fatty acid hydroxylase superfamily)
LLTATVQQYPNLFGWVQTGGKWSIALHVLAYLLAYDFCYYWYHRVQHRLHIGWRIHRLHHSDKALNVTTAARHHWLEEPLKVFAVSVPLAFIFDLPPLMVGWFAFAFGAWGFFIHSNLRVGFGPLQYLLVSPQSHRVHHSDQPQHLDKNFAAIFPIWDLIFGTFYRVTRDEYPTTGLNDHADYHSVASAVLSPVVEPKASEA